VELPRRLTAAPPGQPRFERHGAIGGAEAVGAQPASISTMAARPALPIGGLTCFPAVLLRRRPNDGEVRNHQGQGRQVTVPAQGPQWRNHRDQRGWWVQSRRQERHRLGAEARRRCECRRPDGV